MGKWKCLLCGLTREGDAPPDPCPKCGAGGIAFENLEPEAPPPPVNVVERPDVTKMMGALRPAAQKEDLTAKMPAEPATAAPPKAEQYLLVGGGVAALEAAKAIRKRDEASSITMVSAERHCPYNRPGLSGIIASGAAFDSLLLEAENYYPAHGIDLRCGVSVKSIDAGARTVTLSRGGKLPYTKLLLATGANPFNPIIKGRGSVPVKVLRCYEDAADLGGHAQGLRIVLAGGGILGLEAAVSLVKRGAEVTVVEFAPRILPLQTDEVVSGMLAQALGELGIKLMCGHSVQKAVAEGVILDDETLLPADLVLASMGVRSAVALAEQIGLAIGRGIVVDEQMRTSLPGIWAAGDCAEYGGRVQALAGAARMMGAVAGASMAGDENARYTPFTPGTIFSPPGFTLFSVGTLNANTGEDALYYKADEKIYRRLFLKDGQLEGALFTGKYPAGKLMKAVAEKASLAECIEVLV